MPPREGLPTEALPIFFLFLTDMEIKKSRWLQLALFCVINLFAGSFYVWSVFAGPLAVRLTDLTGSPVTAADLGMVFATASAVNPVAMILGGWANDRFGPRFVIPFGGAFIGSGLFLSGCVESQTMLLVVYGLVFGFGVGLTYTSTIGTAIKYFPDKRGLAGGISSMSYGLSAIVLPPVASALILAEGIETTLMILGGVIGIVIVGGGLLSRRCPDDIVARLLGRPVATGAKSAGTQSSADKNWLQMIATPIFWTMLLFFVSASTGAMMMISSVFTVSQGQIGVAAQTAALLVSGLAVMNAAGRFIAGSASDRFGRLPTLFCCMACEIAGLLLLLQCGAGDLALFFVGISLIGICYGGFVGIYPGFTVDQFGAKHNSVNYGLMAAGFSSGGILGPVIMSSFAQGNDFGPAYVAALCVCGAGLVFGALCVFLQKKKDRTVRRGAELPAHSRG